MRIIIMGKGFDLKNRAGNGVAPVYVFLALLIFPLLSVAGAESQQVISSSRLIGTMSGRDVAGAVISDAAGLQKFYHVNERLPDGSTLLSVGIDTILLKGPDGSDYEMYIAHEKANPPPDSSVAVSPAVIPGDKRVSDGSNAGGVGGEPGSARHQRKRQALPRQDDK